MSLPTLHGDRIQACRPAGAAVVPCQIDFLWPTSAACLLLLGFTTRQQLPVWCWRQRSAGSAGVLPGLALSIELNIQPVTR